ncbi:hypothetical protein GCM10010401_00300 [Rarobacter faecitabidus]|uniref:Uncharacterized protein n=1 Tax=Rarobacter faecitabidus TaxID=13243 RepID=A0A542ZX03_RARFA|nr:DUF342 domain-containing protein [Rarobacter faecitabidus]TQL64829.1 hypothetical protein FB461_1352 [Rarobacter faecitabidus]
MTSDSERLRTYERELASLADSLRQKAANVTRQLAQADLPSLTGIALRGQVDALMTGCRGAATTIEAVARLVAAHRVAAERVQRAIQRVETGLSDALQSALRLAREARRVDRVIPITRVNPWMTVLGTLAPGSDEVRVNYYEHGNACVDPGRVGRALSIAQRIPAIPPPGALAWLSVPSVLARYWN